MSWFILLPQWRSESIIYSAAYMKCGPSEADSSMSLSDHNEKEAVSFSRCKAQTLKSFGYIMLTGMWTRTSVMKCSTSIPWGVLIRCLCLFWGCILNGKFNWITLKLDHVPRNRWSVVGADLVQDVDRQIFEFFIS